MLVLKLSYKFIKIWKILKLPFSIDLQGICQLHSALAMPENSHELLQLAPLIFIYFSFYSCPARSPFNRVFWGI